MGLLLWTATELHLISDDSLSQPGGTSASATKVDHDFSRWCAVGDHHFTLEKTTLDEIAATFKGGSIVRDGNPGAASFQWLLRYRWKNDVVVFSSNNDLGGPSHDLEEIDVQPASDIPDASKLPEIRGTVRFPFGSAGLSFDDLQKALGRTDAANGIAQYTFAGHRAGADSQGKSVSFDVSGSLRVKVSNGKIGQMEMSHLTTL